MKLLEDIECGNMHLILYKINVHNNVYCNTFEGLTQVQRLTSCFRK